MKNLAFKIFLFAALFRLAANMVWFLGGGMDNENNAQINLYFISVAVLFSACTWYVRQAEKEKYRSAERYKTLVPYTRFLLADFFFNLAFTKVFTELFYDATKIQVYEYWNLGACLLILFIRLILH